MQLRFIFAAVLFQVFAACSSTSPGVPRADCEALRDHLVALSVANSAGTNPPSERVTAELEKHAFNLTADYGEDWLRRCHSEFSPEHVRCSLQASNKTALAACTERAP